MANNETGCQNVISDTQNDHDQASLGLNVPFQYETRVSEVRDQMIGLLD